MAEVNAKIYVPVPVDVELPDPDMFNPFWQGFVIREGGTLHVATFKGVDYNSFAHSGAGKVTHWLKEVILPDEFQVKLNGYQLNPMGEHISHGHCWLNGFIAGARYITNLQTLSKNE